MPYRSRRGSRGAYYRRRPPRPTVWVRNQALEGRVENTELYACNLLAPLHTGDANLRIGGSYQNAPSSTGRTVVRIFGQINARWHIDDLMQWSESDGLWVGIRSGLWISDTEDTVATAPTAPNISGNDPNQAANTTDWMMWDFLWAFDEQHTDRTSDIEGVGQDILGTWRFDVRSKRKLEEMGDTVAMCIRPNGNGTQGVEQLRITSSVLLR